MGADTVAEAFAAAVDDPEVGAILFRVDSGGGSAVASETIARAVRRAVEAGESRSSSRWATPLPRGILDRHELDGDRCAAINGSIGVVAGKMVFRDLSERLDVRLGQSSAVTTPTCGRRSRATMRGARTAAGLPRSSAKPSSVAWGQRAREGAGRGRGPCLDGRLRRERGLVDEPRRVRARARTDQGGGRHALRSGGRVACVSGAACPWQEVLELLGDSPGLIDVARPGCSLPGPGCWRRRRW